MRPATKDLIDYEITQIDTQIQKLTRLKVKPKKIERLKNQRKRLMNRAM